MPIYIIQRDKKRTKEMGLAAPQARLLTLTARKSDVEYGISMNALEKMSLTREMSKLTNEYNMKMNSKKWN